MLIGVILLALPCLVASNCNVKCGTKTKLVRDGDCVCSPKYRGYYAKGDYCTVRLTLNKNTRVRLVPEEFRLRYGGQCSIDALKFYNKYNTNKKDGYWMASVCKKDQMHGDPKAIIINSPQVQMKFRADKKGERTNNKKWKLCLKAKRNPEIKKVDSCTDPLTDFVKGYNKRTFMLSNTNASYVTKVCCTSMDLADMDQTKIMCVDASGNESPVKRIKSNGKEVCIYCNSMRPAFHVEVDVVNKVDKKKVTCTCTTEGGVPIDSDCTGNLPCIDNNDLATCDSGSNLCVCPDGYVVSYDGRYCTTEKQLNEDCSNGENCVSTYDRAECDGSTCVCQAGYELSNGLYRQSTPICTKAVAIGEDCSGELTCLDLFDRATCDAGGTDLCVCPDGTVPNSNNSLCTKDNNYKGDCEYDEDCTQTRSKKCDTGTGMCVCESPFSDHNGKCSYKSNLNGICTTTSVDCVVSNSACTSGKCKCKSTDYKAQGTTTCAPVCRQKDGRQILKTKQICNKKKSKGPCYLCECHNPIKNMKQVNSKSSCGKINACKKSSVVNTNVKNGNNCGE